MNNDDLKKELNEEELDAIAAGRAMVRISTEGFEMNITQEKYEKVISKEPGKFKDYKIEFYDKWLNVINEK